MARHVTIKCDNCPAVRNEANHWFGILLTRPDLIRPGEDRTQQPPTGIYIEPWNPHMKYDREVCGEKCLLTVQSKVIAEIIARQRECVPA